MQIKLSVPTHLSEITLKQYQAFYKLSNDANNGTTFLMQKAIEIFCNIDLKQILEIQYKDISRVVDTLTGMFEQKQDLIPTFKMGDQEYGFIPALDDMSLGEYIDLDENFHEWETMHKAMAVLYRPIEYKRGNKYTIEKYKGMDYAERMLQMPMDVVMGSMVFFYNLNNELLQTTLSYLRQEMPNKLDIQQQKILEKSGVGLQQFLDSLVVMLPNLTV